MPPADSTTPTPPPAGALETPAPEAPKPEKVGFFARLFGKKPSVNPVPEEHVSQAPPPQLSEPGVPDAPLETPIAVPSAPVVPDASTEMPSMPESNPTEEPKVDEGMAVPPVTDTPAPESTEEKPVDPTAPKL